MIVIHIGTPKTGSSTIQRFLSDNEDALRDLSVDYPSIGREEVAGGFKHGHISAEVKGGERALKKGRGAVSSLVEHIGRCGHATTIISSETFCLAGDEGIAAFRQALSATSMQIRIVLVIRNLIDSIVSSYTQRVKYGARTDNFDSFFAQRTSHEGGTPFKIAERWANVFGWDAMAVRVLEAAALTGGDLLTDFLATAGLDPNEPRLSALPRPPRINPSPGWRTVEAVRAVFGACSGLDEKHPLLRKRLPTKRLARREFGEIAQQVGQEMGWNQDRGQYFTLAQAASCSAIFRHSVDVLNERLSRKLPPAVTLGERGFIERPFLPDVSRIDKAALMAFYDEWGARRVARRRRPRLKTTDTD